jgi:Zn-dependent oligopeptidase
MLNISQYADNPETRRRAQLGFEGKTIQNVPVLAEIVQLRKQVAEILGFNNFADYILDVRRVRARWLIPRSRWPRTRSRSWPS